MRVLIVGLPLFTERLQKELSAFDPSNTYYRLDTYYNRVDRVKAFFLIPRVDVVYSINGALDKSRVFDLAFKFRKKVMMTWVGTDVTKALKLKERNEYYLKNAEHYCEVSWIQNELKELGIQAEILNFFNFEKPYPLQVVEDKKLKVLTYISKNREIYYGWEQIISAARINMDVDFIIVGTDGKDLGEIPENVNCLGWVENMEAQFNKAHCTIRFVEHDGLSGFVLESLYRGKQVLYSEPLEHCIYVKDANELCVAIDELKEQLGSGSSLLNEKGAEFVENNFNRTFILNRIIEKLKS